MLSARRLSARLILLAALCGTPPLLPAQTTPPADNAAEAPPSERPTGESSRKATQCSPLPTDAELERAGARIGHIYLNIRQIFDLSDPQDNNWIFRMADRLHFETRERAIRAQLLFASGDRYSRTMLDETARIMRVDYDFIREPQIRPICYHDGMVDILVIDPRGLDPAAGRRLRPQRRHQRLGHRFFRYQLSGFGQECRGRSRPRTVDRASTFINWTDPNILGSAWIDAAHLLQELRRHRMGHRRRLSVYLARDALHDRHQ